MALDAIVSPEAHAKLPDHDRGHYTLKDGKYHLGVNEVEGFRLENTTGLRSALEKERTNVTNLTASLRSFDGLDAAKAREALSDVEKMRSWTPEDKVKDKINSTVKQVEEKHAAEMKQVADRANRYRAQSEKLLVDSAVMSAINKHGGSVELLLPHVRQMVQVHELQDGTLEARVVGPDGTPRISLVPGATGPMGIDELVTTLKTNPVFQVAFAGNTKGGSGSSGHTGESSGDAIYISEAEARDVRAYRNAREAADKAGKELRIR